MQRLIALLLCAVPALAQQPTLRDSAGVRIVTSSTPALSGVRAMRIEPAPRVVIPEDDSEMALFSRIAGVGRLSDGRTVVADGASNQLRFFDRQGRFVSVAAGKGGGPGETTEMTSLAVGPGDTLTLIAQAFRVAYYDGQGKYLHDVNLMSPPAVQLPAGVPYIMAALSDGTSLVTPMRNVPPRPLGDGRHVSFNPFAIVSRSHATLASLGELPLMEMSAPPRFQPPWMGPGVVATGSSDRLFLGFGAEYSIRTYDRQGRLTQIVRRAWTPPRVTEPMREAFIKEWTSRWVKSTGPAREKEIAEFRQSPIAPTLPAFSRFLVDRSGRLWVRAPNSIDAARSGQLYTTPLAPSAWSVFERDGTWRSEITLPADFHPFDIGTDFVLGVLRDTDGVETVVQYRLLGG
jgi:hypothetical protein